MVPSTGIATPRGPPPPLPPTMEAFARNIIPAAHSRKMTEARTPPQPRNLSREKLDTARGATSKRPSAPDPTTKVASDQQHPRGRVKEQHHLVDVHCPHAATAHRPQPSTATANRPAIAKPWPATATASRPHPQPRQATTSHNRPPPTTAARLLVAMTRNRPSRRLPAISTAATTTPAATISLAPPTAIVDPRRSPPELMRPVPAMAAATATQLLQPPPRTFARLRRATYRSGRGIAGSGGDSRRRRESGPRRRAASWSSGIRGCPELPERRRGPRRHHPHGPRGIPAARSDGAAGAAALRLGRPRHPTRERPERRFVLS
jgi:hypothetical protein